MEQFFNTENPTSLIDNEEAWSEDDKIAIKRWEESCIFENGHYTCDIPFREDMPEMPDSYPAAMKRLNIMKNKFKRDPQFRAEYTAKIQKLLDNGHAELAPSDIPARWTLSHFAAWHPFKPGPRPVYDCAAKIDGVSLNSTALSGPNLVNPLLKIFINFREGVYRVMSDIDTMFYSVHVPLRQRCYLRFWWFPQGDINRAPLQYQLTVHLFGGTWSPGVSAFCLRKTILDQVNSYTPMVREIIENKFYVDDMLHSDSNIKQITEDVLKVKECIGNKGFNLAKFMANDKRILAEIPHEYRAKEIKDLNLDDALPIDRALGQFWNSETDEIIWGRKIKERPFTKRGLLSVLSSCFDPAGFLNPCILEAKLIFQSECRQGHLWDQELSKENAKRWQKWLNEIPNIDHFSLRCGYFPAGFGNVNNIQLHSFCDGSSVAYGSVHYLRAENEEKEVCTSLVLAKSRLKPLNHKENMTIPKTELNAAVQSVQLASTIEHYLNLKLDAKFFWTDSTIVLSYINNLPNRRLKVYVNNRMSIIWSLSEAHQWRFCESQQNPGDFTSKGKSAAALVKAKIWTDGPEFLKLDSSQWPKMPQNLPKPESYPGNKDFIQDERPIQAKPQQAKQAETQASPIQKLIQHHTSGEKGHTAIESSTWTRLRRSVAWIQKVINMLQQQKQKQHQYNLRPRKKPTEQKPSSDKKKIIPLTAEDMMKAEKVIIREIQKQHLGPYVTNEKGTMGLPKNHKLYSWRPHIDPRDGILKIKTRIRHHQTPVIIPDDSLVADILIIYFHHKCGHAGREFTIAAMRRAGYWTRKPRNKTKKYLRECLVCQRLNAKENEQLMGDLPLDRTTPNCPCFTFSGIDLFGPFSIQVGLRSRRYEKRWAAIFSCATSRAMHLEPVYSMDHDSLLLAVSRFQNRRKMPLLFRTDNGTNLTAGEKVLNEALREFHKNEKVQKQLATMGVTWKFTTPTASNQNSFVERCIRSVRRVMDAIMDHNPLNDEKFLTLLVEIEDILNQRPLVPHPQSPHEPCLTPNDLLKVGHSVRHPLGSFQPGDVYRSRWRHTLHLANEFYRKWVDLYLPLLYKQSRWLEEIQVGDLVLLMHEPHTHRHDYPIGHVTEVYPGQDGLVRNVQVRCRGSVLRRPINKLCKLEGIIFKDPIPT